MQIRIYLSGFLDEALVCILRIDNMKTKGKMTIIIGVILVLFQVMGFFSSIHAVLRVRTSQGAIAWVVSLNALPIVSVPAYWIFGRSKFNGYTSSWRENLPKAQDTLDTILKKIEPYHVESSNTFPEYEAVKKLANLPFLHDNKVTLLQNGKATYESISRGISEARSYIIFQFYIFRPDDIGNAFKKQLIEKALEGVSVYVLYDELGSKELTREWLADLVAAGIEVLPFNTRQGADNMFQFNFRNHRKLVVVDGETAWLGGLNVGDDYLGKYSGLAPWRDTHLRIEGPAALAAQAVFVIDWSWASSEVLLNLKWQPHKKEGAESNVLILGSGPADEQETASLFFTNLLNAARTRIWIATPYFVPDEATLVALRLALLKGLDVRIITPGKNDNWFVDNAAKVYLSELGRLGAKIYSYQKGFMHQKVMLVDNRLTVIGTVNFDNRSFRLNFEISGAVADAAFAAEVEQMLLHDISDSRKVIEYHLDEQSLWTRFKARGASLLAPVL